MSYSFDDYQGHLDEMLRDAYTTGAKDMIEKLFFGRTENADSFYDARHDEHNYTDIPYNNGWNACFDKLLDRASALEAEL